MDEIERRLIKVEEQLSQLARGLNRMEQAIEKMAESIHQLATLRAQHENHNEEIMKLREKIHEHAQWLSHIPIIEDRLKTIESELDKLGTILLKTAGATSIITALIVILIKWGLG